MLFERRLPTIYFDDEGGSGGGSDDAGTDSGPAQRALDGLLGKMGDANKVALHLLDENYRYRQTIRDLKGKLPPEGSAVLPKGDKDLLDRYRALGEPEKLEKLQTELDTSRRERLVEQAADVTGFKPAVLKRLLNDETLAIRQETVEGQSVNVAVVLTGEGKEAVRLEKYAEANWPDFLPALQASAEGGAARDSQGDGTSKFVKQQRGKGTVDPIAARINQREEARKAAKNPLI